MAPLGKLLVITLNSRLNWLSLSTHHVSGHKAGVIPQNHLVP